MGATVGSHPGTPQTTDQGRGSTPGLCKHHSGAGPTLGPHRPPLRGGPHPTLCCWSSFSSGS